MKIITIIFFIVQAPGMHGQKWGIFTGSGEFPSATFKKATMSVSEIQDTAPLSLFLERG